MIGQSLSATNQSVIIVYQLFFLSLLYYCTRILIYEESRYAESYGAQAMATPTPGDPNGIGIFQCLPGDLCQLELYDYGPISSDYPNFPVMTERRWNLHNVYKAATPGTQRALHEELKAAYCSTRRLAADRMGCGGQGSEQ